MGAQKGEGGEEITGQGHLKWGGFVIRKGPEKDEREPSKRRTSRAT